MVSRFGDQILGRESRRRPLRIRYSSSSERSVPTRPGSVSRGCLALLGSSFWEGDWEFLWVELPRFCTGRDFVKRTFLEVGATLSHTEGTPEIAVEYRRRQAPVTLPVSGPYAFSCLPVPSRASILSLGPLSDLGILGKRW